jgi:hypothetical protein
MTTSCSGSGLPRSTEGDIGIFASAVPIMFLKLIALFGNILDYADKNTRC